MKKTCRNSSKVVRLDLTILETGKKRKMERTRIGQKIMKRGIQNCKKKFIKNYSSKKGKDKLRKQRKSTRMRQLYGRVRKLAVQRKIHNKQQKWKST